MIIILRDFNIDSSPLKFGDCLLCYHGTKDDLWKQIQNEGVLWGRHWYKGKEIYRYTYLSPYIDVAEKYGDVLLEIRYTPKGVGFRHDVYGAYDNFGFNPPSQDETCWQFSVFVPIPLRDVTRIK